MKKLFTFLVPMLIGILLPASVFAQSPEKMSYQAVIRDAGDNLVTYQTVGMQISILQGSESGTSVYAETQTPTTNATGLVSIEIGDGTVQNGDFTSIDWSDGPYFIKTETDPEGATNYTITGTNQLLSVPYALHAKAAETVMSGITEIDPVYSGSEAANIDATDITNLGNLSGVNTGDQDISALATKTVLGDSTAQVRSEIPKSISDLSMNANSQNITDLADPLNNQDAATKAYVDALLARIEALEELKYGFTDARDGNHYDVVKIGNQIWMAENLKYLPSVVGAGTGSETTAYYYVFGYDGTNVIDAKATLNYDTYGVLYNWTATMYGEVSSTTNPSGIQGVCPTGWHLPSDAEWKELEMSLGMPQADADGSGLATRGTNEGSKLAGYAGLWSGDGPLDIDAHFGTSGFTALPGGSRYHDGTFYGIGLEGAWWSATQVSAVNAWARRMHSSFSTVNRDDFSKELGFSVRCLKD